MLYINNVGDDNTIAYIIYIRILLLSNPHPQIAPRVALAVHKDSYAEDL